MYKILTFIVGALAIQKRNIHDFRVHKFDHPPNFIHDHILVSSKSNYQPIIGILTQPVSEKKKKLYNTTIKNYILEVNESYIRWSGSRTIAIPYDIEDGLLDEVLDQINGVLLTGGSLDLVNKTSGEPHPYFLTAKRIFEYSKTKMEKDNEEWPILGTCQGFQILSILASNDDFDILEVYKSFEENRKVHWSTDFNSSHLFHHLSPDTASHMSQSPLTFHVH